LSDLRSSAEHKEAFGKTHGQYGLPADLCMTKLEGQMQTVGIDGIELDDLTNQLIQDPGIRRGGF
jgi:hypothetical protein